MSGVPCRLSTSRYTESTSVTGTFNSRETWSMICKVGPIDRHASRGGIVFHTDPRFLAWAEITCWVVMFRKRRRSM